MAKKNNQAQANVQVLARMTLANGAVVDIYDIDLARQMGLVPGSADAGNAPAQEATTSAKQKKSGKGKGKSQPKVEKPKVNPFKVGDDGVSAWHKSLGLSTPEQVEAYKQAYKALYSAVWTDYVHKTGYKGKALSEKHGNDIKAEARKQALAQVLAK